VCFYMYHSYTSTIYTYTIKLYHRVHTTQHSQSAVLYRYTHTQHSNTHTHTQTTQTHKHTHTHSTQN